MGSFSIWHWLIVLVVVVLVFGTGKLKNAGSDLGKAVKGFKDGVKNSDEDKQANVPPQQVVEKNTSTTTIDVETREKHRP